MARSSVSPGFVNVEKVGGALGPGCVGVGVGVEGVGLGVGVGLGEYSSAT